MEHPVVAVVLAGGTGTRLYPASRPDRPKQMLSLGTDRSLLAATVDRAAIADEVYVLTRADLAATVREAVPGAAVITEPTPRDTGPALAYAAHRIREQVGEAVLWCLPSDHRIGGDFAGTMKRATTAAVQSDGLVTVGIEPDRPATGYGYLEPGSWHDGYRTVNRFVEKPDVESAREYVANGYLWNAGIFAWTPTAFLQAAAETPLGEMVAALDAGEPERAFECAPTISVDRAVLERADDVFVVPADFDWSDLGTWDAVWRSLPTDGEGIATLGDGMALDCENCLLASDGHVAAVGLSDLIVASFGDRTLVVPRGETERVREVVDQLES